MATAGGGSIALLMSGGALVAGSTDTVRLTIPYQTVSATTVAHATLHPVSTGELQLVRVSSATLISTDQEPATGTQPAVAATGTVRMMYSVFAFGCFFGCTALPSHVALPAGLRAEPCLGEQPKGACAQVGPPFITTAPVDLAIADCFIGCTNPGKDVPVRALVPGAAGNVHAAGWIVHGLPGYVSAAPWSDPSGGADMVPHVVTGADIAAASGKADADVRAMIRADIEKQARARGGLALVGNPRYVVQDDHMPGEGTPSPSVSVTASGSGEMLALSPSDLSAVADAALRDTAPARGLYELPGSLRVEAPVVTSGNEQAGRFDLSVHASARFTGVPVSQLQRKLAGQTVGSAKAELTRMGATSVTITSRPLPLPFMAPIPEHVRVEPRFVSSFD